MKGSLTYDIAIIKVENSAIIKKSNSKAIYDNETGNVSILEEVCVFEGENNSLVEGILEKDDIITQILVNKEEYQITRQHQLLDLSLTLKENDEVEFVVIRNNTETRFKVIVTNEFIISY